MNRKYNVTVPAGETIYLGVDLHNKSWHVTARTFDLKLFSASIRGTWQALRSVLERYAGQPVQVP